MTEKAPSTERGTCFVVMGFGKKTDFETGRTLDLNLTYNYIIKPAVTAAGLTCIRADEIKHTGPIDTPMYEQLLRADVVVADLSTSNKNAYYELGVRHALRPYTTVVICEDGIKAFPFDVNHVVIRQYRHMGEGIDYAEVERFRKVLTEVIQATYANDPRPKDSPVYTFLNQLSPPALAAALHGVAAAAAQATPTTTMKSAAPSKPEDSKLYSELMQEVEDAKKAGLFGEAKTLLTILRRKTKAETPGLPEPCEDPYIIQQLALVTYKEKHTDLQKEIAALGEASDLLSTLSPTTCNDPETLGLWGAVHKRLWDRTKDAGALDKAIRSYERGFYLRNDYYNGINFAFLLNLRAKNASDRAKESAPGSATHVAAAIADFVQATRARQEVLSICEEWIGSNPAPGGDATDQAKQQYLDSRYWILATKAEAYLGMGRNQEADAAYEEAAALARAGWMIESSKAQRAKLEALLADSPLQYVTPAA